MNSSVTQWLPDRDDILEAMERVRPHIERTPLIRARGLDRDGHRVFLKLENLQRTGSFKVRGAFNALAALPRESRERGVITHSSGNFAQALALAARELGQAEHGQPYPCVVCMPRHANPLKVDRTRALGAEIVFCGEASVDRERKAHELADETGRDLIPSYDHRDIICGQGTLGIELSEQWASIGGRSNAKREAIVAGPVGGGGLMSGTSAALRACGYEGRIIGVEPAAADDTRRSMEAGRRVRIDVPQTICDGLLSVIPGELTFPILQRCGVEIVTVDDEAVRAAAVWLLNEAKLLVEPSGAVTVAAWRTGTMRLPSDVKPGEAVDVVMILSGGNTDPSLVAGWAKSTDGLTERSED